MFFSRINYINCILVFETYLASILLCTVYEKRSHFFLRVIPSSIIAMTIGYFFPYWSTMDSMLPNVFYWIFMYTFLFSLTLPMLLLCYKIDLKSAFAVTIVSYMVHHTNNVLKSNILDTLDATFLISETNPVLYIWINCILYALVISLVYFVFFLVLFKQKKLHIQAAFHSSQLIIFGTVVVFITIVFSSGIRLYYYVSEGAETMFLFSMWQNFFSCLILWFLYFTILRHNHMESELAVEKKLLEENKKHYDLSKENIESLNIKFHDLKYRMQLLIDNAGSVSKEDMEDIKEGIGIYDSIVKTGNTPLDVILTQYALRCENNHISFTSIADGKALDFMSPYDIYSLFGNAITNAIEAVMKLEENDKRQISLVIKKKGDVLLITIENYYDKKPILQDKSKHIISSKKNSSVHGYGTKSMYNIVEKYKGTIQAETHNDIYTLTMAFYLPTN